MQRTRLLYVTPVVPSATGSGLAMRAQAVATALSATHSVQVRLTHDASVRARVRRTVHDHVPSLYPQLFAEPSDWREADARQRDTETGGNEPQRGTHREDAERVHVFRHFNAPAVESFIGRIPCQLDLDESECRTRTSLAALARRNGDSTLARLWEHEAAFYAREERRSLPAFERVFVSSDVERQYLAGVMPGLHVEVLPNTVVLPSAMSGGPLAMSREPQARTEPFTFLFVGSLGYYPNSDAVRFFITDVLPLLLARPSSSERRLPPFRIVIAGAGATRDLRRLMARAPLVTSRGYVPDLRALYASADAMLVPLRAGGGTRIKVLEAFAHGVPVIATRIGVEGLPVVHGQHALVHDEPEAFADACMRLVENRQSTADLTRNAFALVSRGFTPDALRVLDPVGA